MMKQGGHDESRAGTNLWVEEVMMDDGNVTTFYIHGLSKPKHGVGVVEMSDGGWLTAAGEWLAK
jgi:hypothetical protein